MYFRRQENASSVAEIIRNFYFGDNHIDREAVSEVTNVSTAGGQRWPTFFVAGILNRQIYFLPGFRLPK
jgi:hypothetical protein